MHGTLNVDRSVSFVNNFFTDVSMRELEFNVNDTRAADIQDAAQRQRAMALCSEFFTLGAASSAAPAAAGGEGPAGRVQDGIATLRERCDRSRACKPGWSEAGAQLLQELPYNSKVRPQ